jgi:hypothetical protein
VGIRLVIAAAARVTAVAVTLVVLVACEFGETRPPGPLDIVNDTDRAVEISIVQGGEDTNPQADDPRIEPGERAIYDTALFPFNDVLDANCTDGPIVAQFDDGTEIRVPPPVCTGAEIILSHYATAFEIRNDLERSVRIWVDHDGDLYVPEPGQPTLDPGQSARFALKAEYSAIADDGRLCIDGEVLARAEDAPDLLLSGPICDGDSYQVSEFAGS